MAELVAKNRIKELRRTQTRELFFSAASALIVEKGVGGVSMEEIAQRAGYAKGGIYNYFSGKDKFVCEMVQHSTDRMNATLAEILADEGSSYASRLDRIYAVLFSQVKGSLVVMREIDHFFLGHGKYQKTVKGAATQLVDTVAEFFARGIRDGAIADVDPQLTAMMFLHIATIIRDCRMLDLIEPDEARCERFYHAFRNGLLKFAEGRKENASDE